MNYSTLKTTIPVATDSFAILPHHNERIAQGGLRLKGYGKQSYPNKPLISVITVVFNGEQFLEETILSVLNQTYDNVEYIIIDGGSTDGTMDIVRKYDHAIDYWVSEPDEGIYDAMNKGGVICTGDFIQFLNAGDTLYEVSVLEEVSKKIDNVIILIVGSANYLYDNNYTVIKHAKMNRYQMPISHQAIFFNRLDFNKKRYDTHYRYVADFKYWFQTVLSTPHQILIIETIICNYDMHGLSNSRYKDALLEQWKICASSESLLDIVIGTITVSITYLRMLFIQLLIKLKIRGVVIKLKSRLWGW